MSTNGDEATAEVNMEQLPCVPLGALACRAHERREEVD